MFRYALRTFRSARAVPIGSSGERLACSRVRPRSSVRHVGWREEQARFANERVALRMNGPPVRVKVLRPCASRLIEAALEARLFTQAPCRPRRPGPPCYCPRCGLVVMTDFSPSAGIIAAMHFSVMVLARCPTSVRPSGASGPTGRSTNRAPPMRRLTSQLPIEHWHEMIGDATFEDASSTGWCTMPTGSPSPAARSADSLPPRRHPRHTPTHRSRDPSSSDDRHGAKRVIALDRNR